MAILEVLVRHNLLVASALRYSCVALLALLPAIQASPPVLAERDMAFEQKSMQWMKQTREVDEAIKAGKLKEAESILKSIISDRINYNLDLSAERSSLARVYELMGSHDQAEALYKINLRTREEQDGVKAYTLEFPLNEYADFLEKRGRKGEAVSLRDRANAIELAANKEGEELGKKKQKLQSKQKRRG